MAVDDQYTKSLLHFDGGITDESGKIWTAYGGATTSTEQKKFGTASFLCEGTKYITATNDLINVCTIDFQLYMTSYPAAYQMVFAPQLTNGAMYLGIESNGIIIAQIANGASNCLVPASPIPLNQWNHYAMTYDGVNSSVLYLNGVSVATYSGSYSMASPLWGWGSNGGSIILNNAYLDEPRISNIVRWTSNFTPPTAPYGPESTGPLRLAQVI